MGFISSRARLWGFIAGVLAAALLTWLYSSKISTTRVALINYQGFQAAKFIDAVGDSRVSVEVLPLSELNKAGAFDVALIFGRGLSLDAEQIAGLKRAGESGTALYVEAAGDPRQDLTNLSSADAGEVARYLANGGMINYRNLLRYLRAEVDGKAFVATPAQEPLGIDSDVLFHLDESQVFSSVEAFSNYYTGLPGYPGDGKKIALLTSVPGPFNANRDHLNGLISTLEARGWRVYPIASRMRRLQLLQEIAPDLVLMMPHGRLHLGNQEEAIDWLKQANIPLLAPLSVFDEHSVWKRDPQGFSGPLLTMNVMLPELDGATTPYVINALFENERGLKVFDSIPERTEQFADLIQRIFHLRDARNRDKKVGIVYFRGPGENALVAGGMEVAPSLYNTLRGLRDAGYDVTGLPATFAAFKQQLDLQGRVMTPYAQGLLDEFMQQGNPVRLAPAQYTEWCRALPAQRCAFMEQRYGPAPGNFMLDREGNLAVARLQYGNVVVLPQPLPGIGEDTFKLVHGTDAAPPHSYAAPYLWLRHGFGADAVVHFGTHGSLEFTPSKQVALSASDWADALLGGLPHFYVYTMSNVGEGIIAKRRSYATLINHLTPPFTASGLYSELRTLNELLQDYAGSDGAVRSATRAQIIALVESIELHKDLSIDDETLRTEASWDLNVAEPVARWVETIARERITDGLYALGHAYAADSARDTVVQMAVEKLARQQVRIAELSGDSDSAFLEQARAAAADWVTRRLDGESVETLTAALPQNRHTLDRALSAELDRESKLADAVEGLRVLLAQIGDYQRWLLDGAELEQQALRNALAGGYIEPASGGDPILNPSALPTGRNMTAIDAEKTPTVAAWQVGQQLAENLLQRYQSEHGVHPKKVSFTLWPSSFIHSQGATVAQILYLLGVEPVRDPFGRVQSLQLMDVEQLGRPRVDVLVQTAGQFRDLAASRLALIERAVALAAAADDAGDNYVSDGAQAAERYLLDKGVSPLRARQLSTVRSFGGLNGTYGTGIMGMVEDARAWGDNDALAQQYLVNMGAHYGESDTWGEYTEHLFAAALQNTDVVVQPRSSNTWGALSLDHVYEFMGGLSGAARAVTGKTPDGYFNDFRQPGAARVTSLQETLWMEARTTLLNPKYIAGLTDGGASSAETLAETLRNTFGWEALNSGTIEPRLWRDLFEVYVSDKHGLALQDFFARENPYALQEMTGVMLESARRDFWQPTEAQLTALAELHGQFVADHKAGCGPYTCGNPELQAFIEQALDDDARAAYSERLVQATGATAEQVVLRLKDTGNSKSESQKTLAQNQRAAVDSENAPTKQSPARPENAQQANPTATGAWPKLEWLVLIGLVITVTAVILWRRRRARV